MGVWDLTESHRRKIIVNANIHDDPNYNKMLSYRRETALQGAL